MTTRRHIIRAAAAVPVLAALPAAAAVCKADPAISAIANYRNAHAAYYAVAEGDDAALDAAGDVHADAAFVGLTTVPTTAAGLRVFCELGAWLVEHDQHNLAEWFPGDGRTAEALYLTNLAEAARRLLPA